MLSVGNSFFSYNTGFFKRCRVGANLSVEIALTASCLFRHLFHRIIHRHQIPILEAAKQTDIPNRFTAYPFQWKWLMIIKYLCDKRFSNLKE